MTVKATDVASYILNQTGEITAMRLEQLLYYSQAWHLVWEQTPLFNDPIEAWAYGPFIPNVYEHHHGLFKVGSSTFPMGDASGLSASEVSSVDGVIDFYNTLTAQNLSDLTHGQGPWRDARGEAPSGAACGAIIEFQSHSLSPYKNAPVEKPGHFCLATQSN